MFNTIKSIMLTGVIWAALIENVEAQKIMGLVIQKNPQGQEEALPGANVYWLGAGQGTTTAQNGIFMIDRIENMNTLIISFAGFKSDTTLITNQTSIKVELKAEYLQEVTVQGWKPSSGIDQARGINTVIMLEKELFKAACCNLSESFETNPSVDVAFTDAITGTRQIQMLGLSGPNTMISIENMPGVRGLAGSQGIQFIPGSWINSIQVTKGVGSVVNGYESIAGQINVELKKPQEGERLNVNGYINQSARSEANVNYSIVTGKKWGTTFLLHGSTRPIEMDKNGDSFLDFPTGFQLNAINRWVFNSGNGWLGQFGIKVLQDEKQGGQEDFSPEEDKFTTNRYGFEINTRRFEIWGKLGYQFPGQPYKSIGLQLSALKHNHDSYYGFTTHEATEKSGYVNLIYQSVIGNTSHKYKVGASFLYDAIDERLLNAQTGIKFLEEGGDRIAAIAKFDRIEQVPGAFFEYTYDDLKTISIIAGIRVDQHNLFGTLITPRIHTRINLSETTTLRASVGRGSRLANLLTENTGVLVSARQIIFSNMQTEKVFGFKLDKAWNYGLNFSQDFTLDYRPGAITLDYFLTDFQNQAVLDLDRSAREANFFSLTGKSYSHSLQFQVDYQLMRRLDLRIAYRWLDVKTSYLDGIMQRPLISRHRAFVNVAYETKNKWKFDYTIQWQGKQRLPDTSINPEVYQLASNSPDYFLMNAQITKELKDKWSVYVGAENLTNYAIPSPVIASDQPFSEYFDSSLAWGPIFGSMVYAGFRYRIN